MSLFPSCSAAAMAEVDQHLEMFRPEVTQVNTLGGLLLLANTLQLTEGQSLHRCHLVVGFALKQNHAVTGADESYANINHT